MDPVAFCLVYFYFFIALSTIFICWFIFTLRINIYSNSRFLDKAVVNPLELNTEVQVYNSEV